MENVRYLARFCFLIALFLCVLTKIPYGPFDMKIIDYRVTINELFQRDMHMKVNVQNNENGTNSLHVFANVTNNIMGVLGIKIRCFRWNDIDDKFILTFNIASKNICQKSIFKAIIELIGMDNDCTIKTGVYDFTIADLQKFVRVLTNDIFFYGKYMVITEMRIAGRGVQSKTKENIPVHLSEVESPRVEDLPTKLYR